MSGRGSRNTGGSRGSRGGYDRGGYDRGDRGSNETYRRERSDDSSQYSRGRDGGERDRDRDGRPRGRGDGSRGRARGGDSGRGRGRGGYGGRGGHDSSGRSEDVLVNPDMFEELPSTEVSIRENPVVENCGNLYGTHGDSTELSSNYFRVCTLPNRSIFQYVANFTPEIENSRLRYALINTQRDKLKSRFIYIGTQLYIPERVEDISTKVTAKDGTEYLMEIKYCTSVEPGSPDIVMLFNIIMRKIMEQLNLKQVKRKHYNPKDAIVIEDCKMEVWPGISGSLSFFDNKPLYCVDVSHHVMRRENLYEFMIAELSKSGDRRSKDELEKKVVGEVIMTRYNNLTYRIDSIDWSKNPESQFELKGGEMISYVEYYKRQYSIDIRDLKQPLVVSRLKEKRIRHQLRQAEISKDKKEVDRVVHLIPELSYLTGISEDVRTNFTVMRELSKHTRLAPTARCNSVYGFLRNIHKSDEVVKFMDAWGLEIERKLITIPARRYPPEKIFFNKDESFVPQTDCDWTQAFRSVHLKDPCSLEKWFVVCGKKDEDIVKDFLSVLKEGGNAIGFKMGYPEVYALYNVNVSEVTKELRNVSSGRKGYQLGMFIIPPNRKEIYDTIKTVCCSEQPLITQVVLTKTISRQNALRSVATKVVIQMSTKLGGQPWSVNIPFKQKMIIGIDVCHDTGSTRNSWLGFVASLNDSFTKYYSRASRQPPRTEISDTLYINIKNSLKQYVEINSCLPTSIFVYRDGVGDGQLELVKTHELTCIQNCLRDFCQELGPTQPVPQVVFVIVRKRISTKLFNKTSSSASNPPPGSIVDRCITKSDLPNFYLISQSVREGTVNPTHYIVVYNNTKYTTDIIQRLSYKICHLYFNWMGTIRVPAPCQYAHKLCFLVSQSIKKETSSQLSNLLFYL